jgi:hypothetical protein
MKTTRDDKELNKVVRREMNLPCLKKKSQKA